MTGTNIGYFPWVSFPAKLILHIKLTFSLDVLGTSKEKVHERPFKCNKLFYTGHVKYRTFVLNRKSAGRPAEATLTKGSRHGEHQCSLSRTFLTQIYNQGSSWIHNKNIIAINERGKTDVKKERVGKIERLKKNWKKFSVADPRCLSRLWIFFHPGAKKHLT
jgi:hypothetical protein